MANVITFLEGISIETTNGTHYTFISSLTAFAVVRELQYRINSIKKWGSTPGADLYFARCTQDSCVLTNAPRAVMESVVRYFLNVGKSLAEQAEWRNLQGRPKP
ncbi:MAG: hypothetical protein WAP52_03685 [Candidatus Sungiibacteriota bacterium]